MRFARLKVGWVTFQGPPVDGYPNGMGSPPKGTIVENTGNRTGTTYRWVVMGGKFKGWTAQVGDLHMEEISVLDLLIE